MKKIAIFVVMMIAMMVSMNGYAEEYAMTTIVTSVDYDMDKVIIIDFNGNEWMFNGCEDWEVNDICSCVMNDNNTNSIYDDIIISVRYNGWIEGWLEACY